MTKKLATDQIQSELSSTAFFRRPGQEAPEGESMPEPPTQPTRRAAPRKVKAQPTSQSTSQSTNQSTSKPDNKLVERPKAFYITQRLDSKLDDAVAYLQKQHGIKKADRSVVINALLDNEAVWSDEALDQLVDRVIHQLTSRLIR